MGANLMQLALMANEITPDTVLAALARRIGPANGASVRELASEILGTRSDPADERRLRQVVVKLRRDGHPICATPDEGYHHAANAADLQRTCIHLTNRANTSYAQAAAMLGKSLPDLYGQLGLPIPPANDESQGDSE
jgi:hypothetical protein